MLYIDSADIDQLERLLATGLFDGVTCNPTILQRAGRGFDDLRELYDRSVAAGAHLFFAQATGTDAETMAGSAQQILALGSRARVKLMCTSPGLTVCHDLADSGHEVVVTGITHPAQVLAARAAGARWVAAYVSRATKAGVPPEVLVGEAVKAMGARGADNADLRIIAASLHDLDEASMAAAVGAVDLTLPVDVCDLLLDDATTLAAADDFEAAHAATRA